MPKNTWAHSYLRYIQNITIFQSKFKLVLSKENANEIYYRFHIYVDAIRMKLFAFAWNANILVHIHVIGNIKFSIVYIPIGNG